MYKITIKKNNLVVSGPNKFDTLEEANTWLSYHSSIKTFGTAAWTERVLVSPEIPRHVSEDGYSIVEAVPAVYNEIHHPSEFQVIGPELVTPSAEEIRQQLIEDGRRGRLACEAVLDFVAGNNRARGLSVPQIVAMKEALSIPDMYLRIFMPVPAKAAIQALQVDGEIVTQSLKDGALAILAGF